MPNTVVVKHESLFSMETDIKSHYQNLIIGFGKGGKTLAAWLAERGESVAMVEKSEKMYGGACINIACIPTKSLIKNAEKQIPYEKAFIIKNDLTSTLRKANFRALDQSPLATVISGEASFVSENEVQVKFGAAGDIVKIRADRIFVNTGSRPYLPPIDGLRASARIFTSTALLEQSTLAKDIAIIGGGFIGLEFADMYVKFGAKVTIFESGDTFLSKEDSDVAELIHAILSAKGVHILTGVSVEKVEDINDKQVRLNYKNKANEDKSLDVTAVLVATGRMPNTEGLNLSAAGIKTGERGFITVDDQLKTSSPDVWAIGDCNGGPQFTFISLDDFRLIRDQLSGGNYTSVKRRKQFATSVFLTPQLAHIGLREKEAKERGYDYKVAKLPITSIPRAKINGETQGFLKTVVDLKTNKILGCTLICHSANEMINTIQVAMNAEQDYQIIRDAVFTHPSMTEAFNDLYALV